MPPKAREKATWIDVNSILAMLPYVWLLGVLGLGVQLFWANGRLATRLRRKGLLVDLELLRLAGECREAAGLKQAPWIVETEEVRSPALFGFSAPRLLLPVKMREAFSLRELRYIFLHEFCHVRRRDIALNWLIALLQILHWFNPLVWFAAGRMRSDRELACDAAVLSKLGQGEAKEYGETIIRMLEGFARPRLRAGLVGILEDRSQMKRRVRMISRFGVDLYRLRWAGLACAVLLAVAALTDARTDRGTLPQGGNSESGRRMVFNVLDVETGSPIRGVTLNGANTTDSLGRSEMRLPLPSVTLIRAAGYLPSKVRLEGSGILEHTVWMEPAATIGGIVRDEQRNPIPSAEVQVIAPEAPMSIRSPEDDMLLTDQPVVATDANGRWTCAEVPRSFGGFILRVSHPEHAVAFYTTNSRSLQSLSSSALDFRTVPEATLAAGHAELIMRPGIRISGRITDERGKPIEGAIVILEEEHWSERNRGRTQTGPDGRFSFRCGVAGRAPISVQALGFAPGGKVIEVSPGMSEVLISTDRGKLLRGRMLNQAGRPVIGAEVSYRSQLKLRTDKEGRFSFRSAREQPFMVHIKADGYPETDELVDAQAVENVIRLRNFERILLTGRVLDAASGEPIPRFRVSTSTSWSFDRWSNYVIAAEGKNDKFTMHLKDSFPSLANRVQSNGARKYVARHTIGIKIEAAGYLPDTSQAVAIEHGDAFMEFALHRGEGISGIVREPGGKPAGGTKVFLCTTGILMDLPGRVRSFSDYNPEVLTDQSAGFRFDPQKSVRGLIAIHEKGSAQVLPDQLSNFTNVTLEPWGRVDGTFMMDGKPASGQMFLLTHTTSPGLLYLRLTSSTDAEGRFIFTRVPAGTYGIFRTGRRNQWSSPGPLATLEVTADGTHTVNWVATGRPIVGRIDLAGQSASAWFSQSPISMLMTDPPKSIQAEIDALPPFATRWLPGRAGTDEAKAYMRNRLWCNVSFGPDGSFRIEDVPAGNYLLRLSLQGTAEKFVRDARIEVPEIPGGHSPIPLDLGTISIR